MWFTHLKLWTDRMRYRRLLFSRITADYCRSRTDEGSHNGTFHQQKMWIIDQIWVTQWILWDFFILAWDSSVSRSYPGPSEKTTIQTDPRAPTVLFWLRFPKQTGILTNRPLSSRNGFWRRDITWAKSCLYSGSRDYLNDQKIPLVEGRLGDGRSGERIHERPSFSHHFYPMSTIYFKSGKVKFSKSIPKKSGKIIFGNFWE